MRCSPRRYSALCDCVVRGDVRVGHGDLVAEAVGGQRDDLQLHLLVALRVLALEIGISHGHPVGERGAQLVDDQAAAQPFLELAGRHRRVLALEQLLIARLADELSVLLQPGDRENLLRELVVGDANAVALGFDERHLLFDHLREDLLIDAELPQERAVDAAAELIAIRLNLRDVALLEFAQRSARVRRRRRRPRRARRRFRSVPC